MKNTKLSVIVWNEVISDRSNSVVRSIYPEGLHSVVAQILKRTRSFSAKAATLDIATATLDQLDHGLDAARLETCDVLVWCGQRAPDAVPDSVVDRIHRRVLEGMGLIVLHSEQFSKIFRRLIGTNAPLQVSASNGKERLCIVQASHPIAAGLKGLSESPAEEVHGEDFAAAEPEATVFASQLKGGKAVASGCCWERGYGRMFYFRTGQIKPSTFQNTNVQRILANAVQWAAPRFRFDIADPVSTKRHPEELNRSFATSRTVADRITFPVRQIEPAPLFPTLMDHLQQQSGKQDDHQSRGNDFRKTRVESDRLAKRA